MGKRFRARLVTKLDASLYRDYMDKLHYLGASDNNLAKALQYIIEDGAGEWVALIDIGYASLKSGPRDRWIGWGQREHKNRLRYVVNNTRFLVLPWAAKKYHCIASEALGLVSKRVSADWARYRGHHVLLLETFVSPEREGTCYKAANWSYVGVTSGFGKRGMTYFEHGEKKKVFLYPLHKQAKSILSEKGFPHPILVKEHKKLMVDLNKIDVKALYEALKEVPDPRNPAGTRYALHKILGLTVFAFLSGFTNFRAIAQYAEQLSFEARVKLGFRKFSVPKESAIAVTLNRIDAQHFIEVIQQWAKIQGITLPKVIALDGKTMRASQNANGDQTHIITAFAHDTGQVVGQREVDTKTNEIPEALALLRTLDIRKKIFTLDAMHTQTATADYIVKNGGDYVLPVKDNQYLLALNIERLCEARFSPSLSDNQHRTRKN